MTASALRSAGCRDPKVRPYIQPAFRVRFTDEMTATDLCEIFVQPVRDLWEVFEHPGLPRYFPQRSEAVEYAGSQVAGRSGVIRIRDGAENLAEIINLR